MVLWWGGVFSEVQNLYSLRENQMTIPWTNCSERMPPDDAVIAKVGDDDTLFRVSGILVKQEYNRWKNFSDIPVFWTPYTPEAWAELNGK